MKNTFLHKIKNNIYIYFLVKLCILFFIVFFLDLLIGSLLRNLYFRQESGVLYRTTYSLEKTTSDILIFGSSTANHDYSPEIFQNRLHTSVYNTGRDGISIFYQYAILKGVLKRYSPKIILLNFDMDEFIKTSSSYDKISALEPYYETHPEIRSIVNLKSSDEKLKLLSKIYPFNSALFTILAGNMEFNKKRRADFEGFVPLLKVLNQPIESDSEKDVDLDSNKVQIYKLFIQDCLDNHAKLYIICSPVYNVLKNASNSVVLGERIAEEKGIRFFNFLKEREYPLALINQMSFS